nr:cation:proton antiporter [Prauserella sp. PE36]
MWEFLTNCRVWSESSSVACCSGPPSSARRIPGSSFPPTSSPLLNALANVGIALFMFLIGLELERRLVRERGRGVVSVSLGSVRVAFALGVLLALGLYDDSDRLVFTLFLGVAMSATSFPRPGKDSRRSLAQRQ